MGTTIAAMVRNVVGRKTIWMKLMPSGCEPIITTMYAMPIAPHIRLAIPAILYGLLEGFCCRA